MSRGLPPAREWPWPFPFLNFYLSMAIFGLGSLLFNILCWVLTFFPHGERTHRAVRRAIYLLMRFWRGVTRFLGMVDLDWPEVGALRDLRGVVLVANHPNLLDACWVLAAAPHAVCLYKSSLRRNRFLSASARMAGYICNDRGTAGIREAIAEVRAGALLIVFPEGTRTTTPPLNRTIKPGFALIAREAGVPIQTLLIHSDTRNFTKGRFFTFGPTPMHFRLRFGPRLPTGPEKSAKETAAEVADALRSSLTTPEPVA